MRRIFFRQETPRKISWLFFAFFFRAKNGKSLVGRRPVGSSWELPLSPSVFFFKKNKILVCEFAHWCAKKKTGSHQLFFWEIVHALLYFEEQIHELLLEQNPYVVQSYICSLKTIFFKSLKFVWAG